MLLRLKLAWSKFWGRDVHQARHVDLVLDDLWTRVRQEITTDRLNRQVVVFTEVHDHGSDRLLFLRKDTYPCREDLRGVTPQSLDLLLNHSQNLTLQDARRYLLGFKTIKHRWRLG